MNRETLLESALKPMQEDRSEKVADGFLDGTFSEKDMLKILTGLNLRGFSTDEVVGFSRSLRKHAEPFEAGMDVADTCGTGGDGQNTFNISTATGFLAAAGGVPVAKAGNRSVSSSSGSADVLEVLGFDVACPKEKSRGMLKRFGFCFLFAQAYHPAVKRVAPVRKAMGVKTIFNVLGPLCNPAHPNVQVIGAYNRPIQKIIGESALRLGIRRALILFGNGMDEAGFSPFSVIEVNQGQLTERSVDPALLGVIGDSARLKASSPKESAEKVVKALQGEGDEGKIVKLNAALVFLASEKASTIEEGLTHAEKVAKSGIALDLIQKCAEASRA